MLPVHVARAARRGPVLARGLASSAAGPSNPSASSSSADLGPVYDVLERHTKALEAQNDMLTQIMIKLNAVAGTPGMTSYNDKAEKKKGEVVPRTKQPRGFLAFDRNPEPYRDPKTRLRDWKEINNPSGHGDGGAELKRQAARCMDCGTPFCQTNLGCPVNNLIPEWNELILSDRWQDAIDRLHSTNNFPEFTGRVCPAPCEGSCVVGVNDPKDAVTIKNVEYAIIDRAFKEGWVVPRAPSVPRTNKKVAVVGSGPAGLAVADELNQKGHSVTVFERADRIGGLLMYGIPTMKLSKETVDRRVDLLRKEGIDFRTNADVTSTAQLAGFDATVLALGATKPRDLPAGTPGRAEAKKGIYFAMDFLTKNQKDLKPNASGELANVWGNEVISVLGKNVVVIGGGDTGTDCLGTSLRQYCKSLVNLELAQEPPMNRDPQTNPWPAWPKIKRTDYGHQEAKTVAGVDPRVFGVMTKRVLLNAQQEVRGLIVASVDAKMHEIPNTEREIPADVVILAMGFVGVEDYVEKGFGVAVTKRGDVDAAFGKFATSKPGVFACGDCRRGQSLVVWGIREGRDAAKKVHEYLETK